MCCCPETPDVGGGLLVWRSQHMGSKDRRQRPSKRDWKERKFPLVPGDTEEFIPLPGMPKVPDYP